MSQRGWPSGPEFHSTGRRRRAPSDHLSSWEGFRNGEIGVDSANRPHVCVRISESVDADALQEAVSRVSRRHSVVTARVEERQGRPWIICDPDRSIQLGRHSLRRSAGEARAFVTDFIWSPLDLLCGPLFRTALIRLGPKDHIFLLLLHHFVGDAVSSAILYREIHYAYACLRAGATPAFSTKSLPYIDYLAALDRWYDSPAAEPHIDYWYNRFSGFTPLPERPAEKPRRLPVTFGGTLGRDVAAMSRAAKVTPFAVLLAAQYALQALRTGTTDITIAAVTDGRTSPVLRTVVGYLADRTYYRADLSGNPPFGEIVHRAQEAIRDASKHPFIRFDRFQQAAGRLISAPVFNFRPSSPQPPRDDDSWTPFKPGAAPGVTKPGFSVCGYWLELAQTPNGIAGHIRTKDAGYEDFADQLEVLLQRVTRDPDTRLQQILPS